MLTAHDFEFIRVSDTAHTPTYAHSTDAAMDIYTPSEIYVPAGKTVKIPTGIAINIITPDMFALIKGRSGLASQGLHVIDGVIDPGYIGEIKVIMYNATAEMKIFNKWDRIAQMLFLPRFAMRAVDVTERGFTRATNTVSNRGIDGFGSTGR